MDVLEAFQENKLALARFIHRLNPEVSVEDILQDTFLLAYKAERGKVIVQPKPYLFRIAKHVTLHRLSTQKRWRMEAGHNDERADFSAEEEALGSEMVEVLVEKVNQLTPQAKRVFGLRVWDELSYKEIGDCLGISISTAEKHCAKALKIERDLNETT